MGLGLPWRSTRKVHPGAQLIGRQEAVAAAGADLSARIAASGGIEPSLRLQLWPPLLGLAPWPVAPHVDETDTLASLEAEYTSLLSRSSSVDLSLMRTIDADVPRTDGDLSPAECAVLRDLLVAHCVLQPAWGYFQGMNDIGRVVLAAHAAAAHGAHASRSSSDAVLVHPTPGATDAAPPPRASSVRVAPSPGAAEPAAAEGGGSGAGGGMGVSDACSSTDAMGGTEAGTSDALSPASLGVVFWLLRGVLAHSSDNWAHEGLGGVWRQARTVRKVLHIADPKLARRLDALDSEQFKGGGRAGEREQPLAVLFGPIFLRLKREMLDVEEAMRLWEVCWASGRHFHVLALAALVRTQRKPILRLRDGSGFGELHRLFGALHGTMCAATLLAGARALAAKPAVLAALESMMGVTA